MQQAAGAHKVGASGSPDSVTQQVAMEWGALGRVDRPGTLDSLL